eukprot:2222754-Rhodomonas_salina.3
MEYQDSPARSFSFGTNLVVQGKLFLCTPCVPTLQLAGYFSLLCEPNLGPRTVVYGTKGTAQIQNV